MKMKYPILANGMGGGLLADMLALNQRYLVPICGSTYFVNLYNLFTACE